MHESWITGLVTSLLDSGGVSDQVLLLVKPVCQVKVNVHVHVLSNDGIPILIPLNPISSLYSGHFLYP